MAQLQDAKGRARALLDNSIVWDNHGCMPIRPDDTYLPQLERYRKAGVNVVALNVGFAELPLFEHLRVFELGVRWMLIAYNRNNKAGGGCLDADGGLTPIGRAVIDEMQRVGMVLCLSHAGARTVSEALDYARGPVIFSHSNPTGAWAHPRNISDELMRTCARKGGVVGINGIGMFLGPETDLPGRLFDHLRYAIDLIGSEHVGLSLDYVFDNSDWGDLLTKHPELIPKGMDAADAKAMVEPEAFPEIAERLARTSLTDAQIRGILGENWLRVATQVWR